jgi:hypothetical protein
MSTEAGAMLVSGDYRATGMIADSKSLMHINRVVVLICERGKWSVKASTGIGQSSSTLLNLSQPFVRYLIVCASPEIGSNFRKHVTWRKLHNANNHYYSHSSVSEYVICTFPSPTILLIFNTIIKVCKIISHQNKIQANHENVEESQIIL